MRVLLPLALVLLIGTACSDEPAPEVPPPSGPAWLTQRPESAHPYADETLARFRKLVQGEGWRDPAWNAQGTLEAVHEKTGLWFVLVPAGEFVMGSPESEKGRFGGEEPQHRVRVEAYLLSKTECTEEAWNRVREQDARNRRAARLPIEGVGWSECAAWCREAGLRLPSESEWEYTCRAGTRTRFPSGDEEADLARVAWYGANSGGRAHEAGEKAANAWGLVDMLGNVWEWCEDEFHESYAGAPADGKPWAEGVDRPVLVNPGGPPFRVCRGGSAGVLNPDVCRSAGRLGNAPENGSGFRPAASLPPK